MFNYILKNIVLINILLFSFILNVSGMQSSYADNDTLSPNLSNNKYASELFKNGVENYRTGNIDLAIDYLKRAIDEDNKFADAYDQLSLAYIEQGTVYSRALAEIAIKKAIKLKPKKIIYRIHYGKLMMRQGFRYNAKVHFELQKEKNPKSAEIYLNLGLLYKRELDHFKNMVSVDSRDGGIISFISQDMLTYIFDYEGTRADGLTARGILSERNESIGRFTDFSSWAEKNYANAVIEFSKALEIDPKNKVALHNLGVLALEVRRIDKFIEYHGEIVKNYPDDKDGHLFLAYGYHQQRKDDLAFNEYNKAKSLMQPDERTVFESIEYIIPSDESKGYENLASAGKDEFERTFWKKRDPLYLSQYNERLLEHYSRVAYANLKFGVEAKNIPGWKTDRGKIHIRYGPPNRIVRMKPSYERKTAETGASEESGGDDLDLTEVWYYDGFSFAFEDRLMNNNFRLGANSRFPGVNFPEIAEDIYKKNPEVYKPQFPGKKFDFAYYTSSFRGDNGKSSIEVYYAIPVRELEPQEEKDYNTAIINEGIFFFDDKWNEINKSIIKEKIRLSPKLDLKMNYYVIGKHQLEIEPGEYNFAIEFQEETSKNTAAYRRILKIDSYSFGELKMSDIILASNIESSNENSKYIKNGLEIIPNPVKLFHKNQLMHIYFEIYNLMVNPEQKTKFMVEYKIGIESKTEKPTISRILSNIGKLIGMKEGKQDITASYEYEGINPTEKINLSIDMSATKFGMYTLTITVTDLNSNKKVSKTINLGILNIFVNYLL